MAHYRALGFVAEPYTKEACEAPFYGFVKWGSIELHLALVADLDPATNTSACYLYVDDANALYDAWLSAGVGGRLVAPVDTSYGLRELAHIDEDGNLLRVGSALASTP